MKKFCLITEEILSPLLDPLLRQANWKSQKLFYFVKWPGCVAQSVGHLTRKSGVPGSIPGLATYFRFYFRFFKKGSCQLLAKVCA